MKLLKPRPAWSDIFIGSNRWVSWKYDIYYPKDVDPAQWQAIIRHENVHINRQIEFGFYNWLFKYITSRSFRLDEEARAIAVELQGTDIKQRPIILEVYCRFLAGKEYFFAASSIHEAREAIYKYLN